MDGYVARRNVQLGQRVQAGAPLLSVIALDQVWVEANFKESQLQKLRLGQPVELTADVYGKKVVYHGQIDGLGAGTGAAFALLPAQNATGNWIKVVQRVPVRIKLDAAELQQHPLRVGLSMEARVDVSQTDGGVLAADASTAPPAADQGVRAGQPRGRCPRAPDHRGQQRRRPCPRRRRGRQRSLIMSAAVTAQPDAAAPPPPPSPPARAVAYPPLQGRELVLGTLALSLATFMNVLDTSIANVSIPAICGRHGREPGPGHLGHHLVRGGQRHLRCR